MTENLSTIDLIIIVIFFIIVLFIITMYVIEKMRVFSKELRIINIEINDTIGREQNHWKKKRRKLYLSLLPFVKYK